MRRPLHRPRPRRRRRPDGVASSHAGPDSEYAGYVRLLAVWGSSARSRPRSPFGPRNGPHAPSGRRTFDIARLRPRFQELPSLPSSPSPPLMAGLAVTELLNRMFGLADATPTEILLRLHNRETSLNRRTPRPWCFCSTSSAWGLGLAGALPGPDMGRPTAQLIDGPGARSGAAPTSRARRFVSCQAAARGAGGRLRCSAQV
jgi:hypothetical protein